MKKLARVWQSQAALDPLDQACAVCIGCLLMVGAGSQSVVLGSPEYLGVGVGLYKDGQHLHVDTGLFVSHQKSAGFGFHNIVSDAQC